MSTDMPKVAVPCTVPRGVRADLTSAWSTDNTRHLRAVKQYHDEGISLPVVIERREGHLVWIDVDNREPVKALAGGRRDDPELRRALGDFEGAPARCLSC